MKKKNIVTNVRKKTHTCLYAYTDLGLVFKQFCSGDQKVPI